MVDGNYMSSNKFARFFEVVGEMPLYLFIMVACAVIVSKCFEIKIIKVCLVRWNQEACDDCRNHGNDHHCVFSDETAESPV